MTAMVRTKRSKSWITLVALAFGLLVLVGTGTAAAESARLYEVTENMYFYDAQGRVISPELILAGAAQPVSRVADATLQGWASLGNALCPSALLVTNPRAKTCTVTAAGQDNIDLQTGRGTVSGTYAVVLNVDNPTDAAEYVVQTGAFSGEMDLSTRPLGAVTGTFTPSGTGLRIPFTGRFRLPFNVDNAGRRQEPKRGRQAFYLADDGVTLIAVQASELSLGLPLVRLEIAFP